MPPAPTTRQTLSYLRTLFEERGIRPKNKMGQNFLIDLNLIDLVLRTAELSRDDLALEIGSGTGSLTVRLAEQAGALVSVELDPAFAALTDEAVATHSSIIRALSSPDHPEDRIDRIILLHADALAGKNQLNPAVFQAIADLSARCGTRNVKLVSNLPYAVAVPVISNLLLSDVPVALMVVTVQWEIAERLTATVGVKEYAALAVLVQSLAEVQIVRRLPPAVFWPRPQVDSAIVCIRPDAGRRARVVEKLGSVSRFRNFLRDLYVHRRKNLRGGLLSLSGNTLGKTEIDARLLELGIDGTLRAEALDREQHLRLCEVFG
jgi:16S rRNA (adenine1518-N6/adenine1519-N6)-dimethyltransferase